MGSRRSRLLLGVVSVALGVGGALDAPGAVAGVTYQYDVLGRVVSVINSDGSSVAYRYDLAGNRIQVSRAKTNHAPVAVPDSRSTGYNTPLTFDPRTNDTDTDGDPLSITSVGPAGHGATSRTSSSVTYTPTSGFYGNDGFTYTISDGAGGSASAAISISVATPPAPTAGAASLSSSYNGSGSVALAPGGVYSSLSLASNPSHGSASISGTTATYTPTSGYYGSDSFTYTASGPGGSSSPATVSVSVASPPAPVALNTGLSVGFNQSGTVVLTASGVYNSIAIASNPPNGSVSLSANEAAYTPHYGYIGIDSFTFTATGPGGTSSPATVTIRVQTPPPPRVENVTLTTAYNTTGSVGLSVSGAYDSTAVASSPSHGSASVNTTTGTYTPTSGYSGSDSFTYTASGLGGTSNTATVAVIVSAPAAPTAGSTSLTVGLNTPGSVGLLPGGVYTSLAIAANPSHGAASISGTTTTYTPTSGYSGPDSFTYTATGPGGTSAPGTVSVTVQGPTNHPPTCTARVISTNNPPASVNPATFTRTAAQLLTNCTDPDGDTLTVITPGPYSVTIPSNQTGEIDFTVSDGRGGTADGAVVFSRY